MFLADDEKVYVATYKEIILIFIAFSVVLFVLYPKNLLKEQILQDTSNNDLNMIYLQNMLRQDPSNESLIMLVANNNYKSGKLKASYGLLKPLCSSKNPEIKKNANLLSYKLAKEDYYIVKNAEEKSRIKEDMRDLFKNIVDNVYYTKETLDKFYKESFFLEMPKYTYRLLKEKISYTPDDIKLIRDAYYLADRLDYGPEVLYNLNSLQNKDIKNRDSWILAEYNYYMKKNNLKDAEEFLKVQAQRSSLWGEKLAEFYLATENYKEASQTYMQLYKNSHASSAKKSYFLQALKSLQAGNFMKDAVSLGHRYENRYLGDAEVRVFLLKLYLAANDLQKANDLSKKILTQKRR
ncbi:hypothetical protein [Sulfurimonas sp. HSL-1716]|uniref:hypothetical protein n=1 Tax=Hydrocurvibacter sulfurireducens TaxID=3131937 RepID=UPI0031F90FD4